MHNQGVVSGICMFRFLKKRFKGVAVLETALTLPIIMWLLFSAIELIRIGLAQVSVDSIARECSLALMRGAGTEEFDDIIDKYKAISIPKGYYRYYVSLYPGIEDMMEEEPYGGETIGWAGTDYNNVTKEASPTEQAIGNNYELKSNHAIYNKYQTKLGSEISSRQIGEIATQQLNPVDESDAASGNTFVLTVAVKFPFSSSFVAKLFNGGSNTNRANTFILWARGVGMIY